MAAFDAVSVSAMNTAHEWLTERKFVIACGRSEVGRQLLHWCTISATLTRQQALLTVRFLFGVCNAVLEWAQVHGADVDNRMLIAARLASAWPAPEEVEDEMLRATSYRRLLTILGRAIVIVHRPTSRIAYNQYGPQLVIGDLWTENVQQHIPRLVEHGYLHAEFILNIPEMAGRAIHRIGARRMSPTMAITDVIRNTISRLYPDEVEVWSPYYQNIVAVAGTGEAGVEEEARQIDYWRIMAVEETAFRLGFEDMAHLAPAHEEGSPVVGPHDEYLIANHAHLMTGGYEGCFPLCNGLVPCIRGRGRSPPRAPFLFIEECFTDITSLQADVWSCISRALNVPNWRAHRPPCVPNGMFDYF